MCAAVDVDCVSSSVVLCITFGIMSENGSNSTGCLRYASCMSVKSQRRETGCSVS